MNKFRAVFVDTLLEVRDRKIFYLYWIVTFVVGLVFLLMPNFTIDNVDLFKSGMISPEMVDHAVSAFFNQYFGFMIFLIVFGSAGLVPSFLSKGRIELTLSKPIDRYRLLGMKFISILVIKAMILAASAVILWIILSLRLGSLSWLFFLGLAFSILQLFAVYSLVFLFGTATNSAAVAIMGYFIIRVATGLLAGREAVYNFLGESVWKTVLDGLYHLLPKIGEMADNYMSLMQGNGLSETYPVYSTLGISVVIILVALLIFNRRDY